MQRIADGNIHFLLDFGTVETMKDVKSISVKVKRTQDNLYSNKQIREFCIESTQNVVQKTKVKEFLKIIFLLMLCCKSLSFYILAHSKLLNYYISLLKF